VNPSEEIFNKKTDYRAVLFNFIRFKYYFVALTIFLLVGAFVLNKVTNTVYQNQAMLLFTDQNNSAFLQSDNLMQGFGGNLNTDDLENELGILASYTMVSQTLQEMDFDISYYKEENLLDRLNIYVKSFAITKEIYKSSPFTVIFDRSKLQPTYVPFIVTQVDGETFRLSASGNEVELFSYVTHEVERVINNIDFKGEFKFGETIETSYFSFKVLLNENSGSFNYKNGSLFFQFNNTNYQTLEILGSMIVKSTSKTSSLIKVVLSGENIDKITDFLNIYTAVYLERNLERKNRIAVNTVDFIETQIAEISDSLSDASTRLQDFKSEYSLTDLSYQGNESFKQMQLLEQERSQLFMQYKYYRYIEEYLQNNKDVGAIAAPSAMGVEDKNLNDLIAEMILLNNRRVNLQKENKDKNIFLGKVERELQNLKKTILENVKYNLSTTQFAINENNGRRIKLNDQISQLPQREKELLSMDRVFKLNDNIYTFLMEKRAESQIAKAANAPDCEIVDPARVLTAAPIAPNKSMNYILAIFLGIFVPFLIILMKDFLNDKVVNKRDIDRITNYPLVGLITHESSRDDLVLYNNPYSSVSESFRTVRTNMHLHAENRQMQTVLVTSSFDEEGRKFVAVNLAIAFAMFGKKTAFVSFNLREPSLHDYFSLRNDVGVANYLSGERNFEDIIQSTQIENLDFIATGPKTFNSIELIASSRTTLLFNKLKEVYDYIIVEAAPVGKVTDSYLLMDYSDANLLVVRQNHTRKAVLSSIVQNISDNKMENMMTILNDVRPSSNPYEFGYELSVMNKTKRRFSLRSLFFQDSH
jgi:tyrosine-protein kinase Etk/Wzc